MPADALKASWYRGFGFRGPKGSKYHSGSYLVGVWTPKVYTILLLWHFWDGELRREPKSLVFTGKFLLDSLHIPLLVGVE